MAIVGFVPNGFEGEVVRVEVDLRRGIPGTDIVGLAGGAVREARERVRAATRHCGFRFPADRVLVNLAPAGVRKSGASFDLAIALAILEAAGDLPSAGEPTDRRTMVLGELQLDGTVRSVRGVLPAVASGLRSGADRFIVPAANLEEARTLVGADVVGVFNLADAVHRLYRFDGVGWSGTAEHLVSIHVAGRRDAETSPEIASRNSGDFRDLRGQPLLRRALEIAAAGGHSVLVSGPPGSGKTMAVRRFPSILPPLDRKEALEVTAIHSLAGALPEHCGLISARPFRHPHHSASLEGMIGGGRVLRPGEISLAHHGVLFLDEAHEFRTNVLQSLREPLEDGRISLVRAERTATYPAVLQIIMAANPCPCGRRGKPGAICLCSEHELHRYWKRIGGALMDRIDIRVAAFPADANELVGEVGESSGQIRLRVRRAVARQDRRYAGLDLHRNAGVPGAIVLDRCRLRAGVQSVFVRAVRLLGLSSRAGVSMLRLSRTIADLADAEEIEEEHVLEAVQLRRYDGNSFPWSEIAN